MTELSRNELIKELEAEAERIHNSTRVDIPLFSPMHNYLRAKSDTYYSWSISSKSNNIHRTAALGFVFSVLFFTIIQFVFPNLFLPKIEEVMAGSNSITWTASDFLNASPKTNLDISANSASLKSTATFGDGRDGNLSGSGSLINTVRLDVDIMPSFSREKPDAVTTKASNALSAGQTSITVNSSAGFASGDEILLAQITGTAPLWETKIITNVSGNTITVSAGLANNYPNTVRVQRVPHYTNVSVGSSGNLTASEYNSANNTGGILFFRVSGNLNISAGGKIDLSGFSNIQNGGNASGDWNNGGGGGGYGSNGNNGAGATGGLGGPEFGSNENPFLFGRQGGKGGGTARDNGGKGGGLIYIEASSISNSGTIASNGVAGVAKAQYNGACIESDKNGCSAWEQLYTGASGGGSGGSIWLKRGTFSGNNPVANGGSGGANGGGSGSNGRIVQQDTGLNIGSSKDGYFPTGLTSTFNLNTSSSNGRAYADGIVTITNANMVRVGSETEIPLTSVNGFAVGDYVFIAKFWKNGDPSGTSWNGRSTQAKINRIVSNKIYVDAINEADYRIGVMVQRIPQYQNVIIRDSGLITSNNWNGSIGGVVIFYAKGSTYIAGSVNVSEKGYLGGKSNNTPGTGPGHGFLRADSYTCSFWSGVSEAGPGSYANWASTSYSMGPYNILPEFGSGGGNISSSNYGGNGGGIIIINSATKIVNSGLIKSDGQNAGISYSSKSVPGPGSGGSIHLIAGQVSNSGSISSLGAVVVPFEGDNVMSSWCRKKNSSGGRVLIESSSVNGTQATTDDNVDVTTHVPNGTYTFSSPTIYPTSGILGGFLENDYGLRRVLTTDAKVKPTTLTWSGTTGGAGDKLKFKLKAANSEEDLASSLCYGPTQAVACDDDWATAGKFFSQENGAPNSSNDIISSIPISKAFEVIVYFEGNGQSTPSLGSVTLRYDSLEAPKAENISLTDENDNLLKATNSEEVTAGQIVATSKERTVKIKFNNLTCGIPGANSCLSSSTLRIPEVEIKPIGTNFSENPIPGTDTIVGTSTVGSGDYQSAYVLIGPSMLNLSNEYHFRVRIQDNEGRVSSWYNYGENLESEPDLIIDQTNPEVSVTGFKTKLNSVISLVDGIYYAPSEDIKVTISAQDIGVILSNVGQVQFSNDGIIWGSVGVAVGPDDILNTQDDIYSFLVDTWYNLPESGSLVSASIPWKLIPGDGIKTVYVKVKDNAGNNSVAVNQNISIDTTSPDIGIITALTNSGGANINERDWQTDNTPYFSWNEPADTNGIAGYWWAIGNQTPEDGGSYITANSIQMSSMADGMQHLYVRAVDKAGNKSGAVGHFEIWIDTQAPVIINNIEGGDLVWRNSNSGNYNIDMTDTGIGVKTIETRAFTLGGSQIQDWTIAVDNIYSSNYTADWKINNSTWNALPEGESFITVRVTDGLGQQTVLNNAFKIRKDITSPPQPSVSLSDFYGGSTRPWPGSIPGTATNDSGGAPIEKVEIQLHVSGTSFYYSTNESNKWDGNNSTWLTVDYNSSDNTFVLPNVSIDDFLRFESDSIYEVIAKTTDAAGNSSVSNLVSFFIDVAPPFSGTMEIVLGNPQYTKSNLVTLWFYSLDSDIRFAVPNENKYMNEDGAIRIFKGSPSLTSAEIRAGLDAASWQTFDNSNGNRITNVTLPDSSNDGVKQIWVELRDKAGNISVSPITDTIIYDKTSPVSSFTSHSNNDLVNMINSIGGNLVEDGSGVDVNNLSSTQISIVKNIEGQNYFWNSGLWVTDEAWVNVDSIVSNGSGSYSWVKNSNLPSDWMDNVEKDFVIKVRATDIIGNTGIEQAINIKYDKVAPASPSVSSLTHADENVYYNNNNLSVSWSATDTNGINSFRYVLDQNQNTDIDDNTSGLTLVNSGVLNTNLGEIVDGVWYFHIEAKDNAGNWSSTATRIVKIDTISPDIVSGDFQSNGIDDENIELSWNIFSDLSGVASYEIFRSSDVNNPVSTSKTDPIDIIDTNLTYNYPVSQSGLEEVSPGVFKFNDRVKTNENGSGWYYYKMVVTDKASPANVSVVYKHSKTNRVPDAFTQTVNGQTSEVSFNPGQARTLNISWDATDPDGVEDIKQTKVTVYRPNGAILTTFDEANVQRMSRSQIDNGYRVSANYTIADNEPYGVYTVITTTVDFVEIGLHSRNSTNTFQIKCIPQVAQNLIATGDSSVQITLNWQAPQYADATTKYRLYRSLTDNLDDASWNTSIVDNLTSLTYTDINLDSDKTYYYRIKSLTVNANQALNLNSEFSSLVTVTTPTPAGADNIQVKDVSSVTSGQADERLFIWWDAPTVKEGSNATLTDVPDSPTYVIYKGSDGIYNPTPVKETTDKYYLDTDVDPLTSVSYRIHTKDIHNNITSQSIAPTTPQVKAGAVPSVNITNESASVSSAIVRWDTNIQTETQLIYGTISGNYTQTIGIPVTVASHEVSLRGLKPDTQYFYKIIAKNPASGLATDVAERSIKTNPFTLSNQKVTTNPTGANITWNTNIPATTQIEYQKQSSNQNSKVEGSVNPVTNHAYTIKGLSVGTYSYKLRSYDSDGNLAETAMATFEVPSADAGTFGTPQAAKVEEKDITATSAKVTWTSTVQTSSWVDYGTTPSKYTNSAGNEVLTTTHIVTIENLVSDTTYYYRIRGIDTAGVEYLSKEYSFKALAEPAIFDINVNVVNAFEVIVRFKTNIKTDTGVSYGKDSGYGKRAQSSDLTTNHEIKLTDIEDDTSYNFQIDVRDEAGNSVKSQNQVFKTPLDKTPPSIKDVKLSPLSGSDTSKRGVIITWTTDKESSSQVQYSSGITQGVYNQKTPEDTTLTLSHTVVINSLDPGTTYHFQLLSKDKRGNLAESPDYTMLTQEQEESVLNLILKTLEDTFSWVGKVGGWFTGVFSKLFSR